MSSAVSLSDPPPVVLVVDDDPDLVAILTRFLSRQGMVALSAANGQECLERVRQGNIDVVVLDVMMPGMNGLQVCEALRRIVSAPFLPIILLTARDDPGTRLEGMRLGANEYLVKPTRGQDLVAGIRAHVGIRRQALQLEQGFPAPTLEPDKK